MNRVKLRVCDLRLELINDSYFALTSIEVGVCKNVLHHRLFHLKFCHKNSATHETKHEMFNAFLQKPQN